MMPTTHQSLCIFLLALLANLGFSQDAAKEAPAAQRELAWVTPKVTGTRVSFETFDSKLVESKVSYHIYKPAAYDADPTSRFPVVYWLHGSGGGLPGIPRVASMFDAAIQAGKTPACLVVFVNGLPEGMYVDWKDGSAPIESMIIKELIPHIDTNYRTIAKREARLLDGYSMGGYGAARLGFKYTELFRGISIMGGGPLQAELVQTPRAGRRRAQEVLDKVYGGDQEYFRSVSPRSLAEQHAKSIRELSIIRHVCGDQDETFENNKAFHLYIEKLSIPHSWTVLEGVDHNPLKTIEALGDSNWDFYKRVFTPSTDKPEFNPKPDFEIALKVKQQDRRALVVNAPTDGNRRPAVIALHGGQGSAEVMRANSSFDPLARSEGFMVVYPEGTEFGNGRHAWNTGFLLRRQVRDADDIAYLDILIDKLINEHGADPTRIYMTGGSNGGMMTFVYAVERPNKLAAIAPVVASMFTFDKKPSVPLPILMINGGKDQEVPIEGGMSKNRLVSVAQEAPFKPLKDVVEFWAQVNQSQSKPEVRQEGDVTTSVYAASQDGAETVSVVDSAGGHGWPGSRNRREGNGPIQSFSGAERVWEFFKDKKRAETK